MPKSYRTREQLLSSTCAGVVGALVFLYLFLSANVAGLANTIRASEDPVLPLVMLTSVFTMLFAIAALCTGLGNLSDEEEEGRLEPVRIRRQRSGVQGHNRHP